MTALLENDRCPFLHSLQRHLSMLCLTNSLFHAQNNLLDNNPFGFKSATQLRLPYSQLLKPWDWQEQLDLSAAFYTVNHQILLSTLIKTGISGTALQCFRSYLSGRSFRVSWKGEVSKSQLLATGVPQGSVLKSLLFSIYMSSLGSVTQKHGFSYDC